MNTFCKELRTDAAVGRHTALGDAEALTPRISSAGQQRVVRHFFGRSRGRCNRSIFIEVLGVAIVGALAGCGSLPSSGPSISTIEAGAVPKDHAPNYVLVPVTQQVLNAMGDRVVGAPELHFSSMVAPSPVPPAGGTPQPQSAEQIAPADTEKITPGDLIGVSIYTSGGGLFGNSENPGSGTETANSTVNSATSLPPQLVDSSGDITVPHAGRIPVVGRAPFQVEDEITQALKGQAFNIAVIVSIEDRRGSDLVTITGDVAFPRRISIPMSGLRIVDAIASAGGSSAKDYETKVTVMRGLNIHTESYSDILADPVKNIYLQVGDTVLVKSKPWTYTSLGATGQTLHVFPSEEVSAEEALSGVNGLDDNKANPEAVFIYRFESPERLKSIGIENGPLTALGVPVIYQLNLRDPGGFFMAKQFAIQDKDVIFVGDAGSIGVIKVMNIVGSLTSPAVTGLSAVAGANTLH